MYGFKKWMSTFKAHQSGRERKGSINIHDIVIKENSIQIHQPATPPTMAPIIPHDSRNHTASALCFFLKTSERKNE